MQGKADRVLGWHLLYKNGKMAVYSLSSAEGKKVQSGKTYHRPGIPECCERGLHASEELYDALHHAPGPILCRVESWGRVDKHHEGDKYASNYRHVFWMVKLTHKFLRSVAFAMVRKLIDRNLRRSKMFMRALKGIETGAVKECYEIDAVCRTVSESGVLRDLLEWDDDVEAPYDIQSLLEVAKALPGGKDYINTVMVKKINALHRRNLIRRHI